MAQPPAPYTNPELPDKFIVRSQASSNRLIVVLVVLVCLILMLMALFFLLLEPDPYDYLGEQSFRPSSLIMIFSVLLFTPIIAYFVWLIRKERRTRTVVDGSGLLLEQSGMQARFIPWQNAHGRITIKTVSQYVPGSSTPAMMSLILVVFDQGEIVLPGSILSSYRPRNLTQRSYAIAMRILAYDPWGQREPLMQSENNFTPYAPRNMYAPHNMYMFQNIMRS